MDKTSIQQLLQTMDMGSVELVETHISWVLLTPDRGYKIKKPVRFSFLNFSTLAARKYYCEREVLLNRRLTEGMYLGVDPIRQTPGGLKIGGEVGEVIDYAVVMKRMDENLLMNRLLEKDEVKVPQMHQLAEQLTRFHTQADRVKMPPSSTAIHVAFADILAVKNTVVQQLGAAAGGQLDNWVTFSQHFLRTHAYRLRERYEEGFFIDGHGDLHTSNIFLLDQPVIFDCVEFNDQFREVDIIDELAFFCMDIDAYRRPELNTPFLQHYTAIYPVFLQEADHLLFHYYKFYRANIRLKVNALKAEQATDDATRTFHLQRLETYFWLMQHYRTNYLNHFPFNKRSLKTVK